MKRPCHVTPHSPEGDSAQGDVNGALSAIAEWAGVATFPKARMKALNVYSDLLQLHGERVAAIDLSRAIHG